METFNKLNLILSKENKQKYFKKAQWLGNPQYFRGHFLREILRGIFK